MARRLLFDGRRAIGVEVESGGERFTVEGDQIVLSSGAIGSPHLLLRRRADAGAQEQVRPTESGCWIVWPSTL
jgi:choline dehydrogenase